MAEDRPGPPRTDHDQDERHPEHGWRVNPAPDGRGTPPAPRRWRGLGWILLAFVVLEVTLLLVSSSTTPPVARVTVPYSPTFLQQVRAGNVSSISATGTAIEGDFRRAVRYPPSDRTAQPATAFKTEVPAFVDGSRLSALLERKGVAVTAKPTSTSRGWWVDLLVGVLPIVLIVGIIVLLLRRAGGGIGGAAAFGRARARRIEPTAQRVTFRDVAGIDEAKEQLAEIVDFLRDPDKYRRLGGRIPRGVLLTGPPGTGKTLLARALAGEAGVPFFTISASEFIEMFVGVGASRVRDLFAQAKEAAPAIIFIDELDAIGRTRGPAAGYSGGHEEREQTLNQILTEMDGFDPSIGVIVLSATNRPEIIDRALLRPGRFDRRVAVQPPDTVGRRKILDVHTRSVPLAPDADLDRLAATTPGMVGADLANIVNEGALLAARRGHDAVTMADFLDALEKLILGSERRIMLSPAERRRTAYHEAGHALVGMLTPGADPVRKVSIIPRGQALGVTLSAPEADRFSYDELYLRGKLQVLLAGRVAERLVFGTVTTGAESDLREATELAAHMAGVWGMSEAIGPMTVLPDPDRPAAVPWAPERSAETQRLLDAEVRRALDAAEVAVAELLADHREQLESLVHALLEHETLDEPDAYAAAGLPRERAGAAPAGAPSGGRP
ncbi:MAG TPA: ATP-dependent zinc metalloprotease FtsH [Baekduia sp.]|nr:ATP-dependent zinc metalloprotease FtsH [Baekduia sp.]